MLLAQPARASAPKAACDVCCKLLLALLLPPCVIVVSLFIPGVERQYIRSVETYAVSVPVAKHLLYVIGQVPHAFEYGVVFVAPLWNPLLVHAVDGHQGPGLLLGPNPFKGANSYMLFRVSHESVKKVHYDPKLQRSPDMFVTANASRTPKGYFAPGVLPLLLQQSTDDPAHRAHRDLVVASMPALLEHPPSVPAFRPVPGIAASDLINEVKWHLAFPFPKIVPDTIQDVFAFTFFRHAFGVDLSLSEIRQLKEWTSVNSKILLGFGSFSGGKRSAQLAHIFEDKIGRSEFGTNFLEEAHMRRIDGPGHLRKLIFQFVFAGFGGDGPGGGLALTKALKFIQSSPDEYVPLFKRDPLAFILEVIRMKGGGGSGMNPVVVPETKTYTLKTGAEVTEDAGDFAGTIALHANHDPAVFGGPSADVDYTTAFVPGRENADRLLTFVAEIRDIRKCPNMTGCGAAPRFCLGAFLLPRLLVEVARFYVQGLEGTAPFEPAPPKAAARREEMEAAPIPDGAWAFELPEVAANTVSASFVHAAV
eukprot:CAMPEP_0203892820 /NCGR_PEP_ID=MMETSP0359-20131031/35959_1 /ASSEMBLY_ACC=CAM_ASM_000338 /TAXON_ID=268821 /ORGANISM="Scrippsiella Hangoei, Strain SHTV-5" /LENGTH=534 /DNA_ID=CAMNT_0050814847 /DNA_START=1 /DNA_END=1606 /DNA_ORIENTATION=+